MADSSLDKLSTIFEKQFLGWSNSAGFTHIIEITTADLEGFATCGPMAPGKHGDVTLPRIDAVAGKDTTGNLWLEVTNVDPNGTVEVELNLSGIAAKSATGEALTAPKVDSINTFDAPNTVLPKSISAKTEGGKLTLNSIRSLSLWSRSSPKQVG